MASAKTTPALREGVFYLVLEPRRFVASDCNTNVPRRVY